MVVAYASTHARAAQLCSRGGTILPACLQKKNQELVLKGAKVCEEDMEELQTEFETRLGRAERRVFALTKERDAAKRQLASAITPATLQARDSRIAQVCTAQLTLCRGRGTAGGIHVSASCVSQCLL